MNSSTQASVLINSLRGQQVRVPCLYTLFQEWPSAINPNYERMVGVVDEKLGHIVPLSAARISHANFALFTGAMYPLAEWPEYLSLTTLVLIFFLWDDEIEEGTCSTFSAGQRSRKNAVAFTKHCLGFGTTQCPIAPSLVVESFREVGEHLCEVYTIPQRKLLLSELLLSAEASQLEQELRIKQTIPNLEVYHKLRRGTIAVGSYMSLGEFANRISLPNGITHNPLMETLRREACKIVGILNDIVSLQKELAQYEPSILSYIPLQCAALCSDFTDVDAQGGVDLTIACLRDSIQTFDSASTSLLKTAQIESPEGYRDMKTYIDTVRTICTGTLCWSLKSARYGVCQALQQDGSLSIVL